jgi:hypothetical protein
MRTSRRGLWAALFIAIALWFMMRNANVVPVPAVPTFTVGKTLALQPIECYQAWKCTFNVIGVENVLGRSIMVHIEGIRGPMWGATCSAESEEGERATTYLFEMLASANSVTLVRPYKVEGNYVLIGRVLVDGVDAAQRMIDLGVAAPPGVRMNWCTATKETEV